MNTFTLRDVTIAARHKTGLPTKTALAAAEAYLHQVEEIDGRAIDPDNLTGDDADFLVEAIIQGHAAGDLGR